MPRKSKPKVKSEADSKYHKENIKLKKQNKALQGLRKETNVCKP